MSSIRRELGKDEWPQALDHGSFRALKPFGAQSYTEKLGFRAETEASGRSMCLNAAWKQDPTEIFSELTLEPVAAASLGQVYRGRLRSNGKEVAIKVQRPGLKETLLLDMYIFRRLSELLNGWARRHLGCNVTLVVDEFAVKLWEEANYQQEAQNAVAFAKNFREDASVKIPEVRAIE